MAVVSRSVATEHALREWRKWLETPEGREHTQKDLRRLKEKFGAEYDEVFGPPLRKTDDAVCADAQSAATPADFIEQRGPFAKGTDLTGALQGACNILRSHGTTFHRAHVHSSGMLIVEGWRARPDEQGPLPEPWGFF